MTLYMQSRSKEWRDSYVEAIELEKAKLDTERQIKLVEINNNSELIQLGNYIGEPTPTQFQEAHKKWRRILDERNQRITELERELHIAKNFNGESYRLELEKEIRNQKGHIRKLEFDLHSLGRKLKENNKITTSTNEPLLNQRITEQLKEEVDKLRMSNQEKDIEIQELRDQVTKQAAKWLVPNF